MGWRNWACSPAERGKDARFVAGAKIYPKLTLINASAPRRSNETGTAPSRQQDLALVLYASIPDIGEGSVRAKRAHPRMRGEKGFEVPDRH